MARASGVHDQRGEPATALARSPLEVQLVHARGPYPGLALVQATATDRQAVAIESPRHMAELAEAQPQTHAACENDAAQQARERWQIRDPEQNEARDARRDRE